MTPQYILRKSLCRNPHCFRAWVQGKGYVNDGTLESERADYIAQYLRTAESEIENMGYAPDYAEPGYDTPKRGILFANWNNLPSEVADLLERYGFSIEWSDEWSTCDNCGNAVRTSPDSYSWRPSYVVLNDCEFICRECLDESDYVETVLLNNPHKADQLDVDLSALGFRKWNTDRYENGFHPGQNDNPADIVKLLPSNVDYVFQIDDKGQFDIGFSVWIREKDNET